MAGPLVLLAWGGYGVFAGGLQWFNGIILVVGLGLAAVAFLDYPLWSTLGPDGIVRRCVLRTETLVWEDISTIARPGARQRRFGSAPRQADQTASAVGRAGLVAEVQRRPYLLADRIESPAEHEAIESGLRTWSPGLAWRASKPVEGTPPTWLYKRRRDHIVGMVDWR